MPSVQSILLTLVASTATLVQSEHLRVVWSSGAYSAITGPKGNGGGSGHTAGFAIFNDDGDAIYEQANPYGYSPCFSTGDGREFGIDGDCWDTQFNFHCKANFDGSPGDCAVKDTNGNVLGSGEGQTDTKFIGIAIGQDSTCVVEFDSSGSGCPVYDPDNAALLATGKSV